MHSHCVWASFKFFLYGHLATGRQSRTEAVRRSYGNRAIVVQLPCSLRRFCTGIVRRSCGFHTEAARRCAVAVRGPYDQRTKNYYLKSCDFHKNTARPPHVARMMLLRHVYGIYTGSRVFFLNLPKSSLNKTIEATAPVNP